MILQIAIPKPLSSYFDYLPPSDIDVSQLRPGIRVSVPFGPHKCVGVLLAIVNHTRVPKNKLRAVYKIIDTTPVLSEDNLKLLLWASRYYHHPIGEVISTALPKLLNQGKPAHLETPPDSQWVITPAGHGIDIATLPKNKQRLAIILSLLQKTPKGISEHDLAQHLKNPRPTLRALQKREWITHKILEVTASIESPLILNRDQQKTVSQICQKLGGFFPCLLDGVTGSGKTEVYLQIIQEVLDQGKQALILVPEINLTPQTLKRFKRRFAVPIVVWHSKLNDNERLHTWLLASEGIAPIIIGTRSAIWTPLARPGIFIIDEEHDQSYKQQDHFRYSARDIAVVRAKYAKVPIVLGTATPSLDTLYNVQRARYQQFILPERAGGAVHPSFHIIDMRQNAKKSSLSPQLKKAITYRLKHQQQSLLFLNRRGYAPILTCYQCGWVSECPHCDARLTYHEASQRVRCHHCGEDRPVDIQCPDCRNPKLSFLGQGTERVEESVQTAFPNARILRIDSDSTRNKHAMHTVLEQIHKGKADILIGTQMLAKGHHFPKVTLVGIINIDGGLYGIDFRSTERMAQLLIQVSGRAGRAEEAGEVLIQTYHPDNPLLTRLIQKGYNSFAIAALKERQDSGFPPYSRLALLRAESAELAAALSFLEKAKQLTVPFNTGVQLWGPVTAPMEKRAGWYRAQLLLQSTERKLLHHLLSQWLPKLASLGGSKVRWSLDVDPQDLL